MADSLTLRTIGDFVRAHGITMSADYADSNPNMPDSVNMDHWKVTLRYGRKRMTTYFSQGYGFKGAVPAITIVLDSLRSDLQMYRDADSFEDFASEMGYDADSRRALATYRTIGKQADRLARFLGADLLTELLHCEQE